MTLSCFCAVEAKDSNKGTRRLSRIGGTYIVFEYPNKLSSQCWMLVFDFCLPTSPSNNCYRIQRTLCRTLQNLIDLCILIALTSTLKMFWLMQCLHINGYQTYDTRRPCAMGFMNTAAPGY